MTYRIIPYADAWRDDMIFMILEAKDALGRIPRLNEDLLDIPANYIGRGDAFWLAVSDTGRVIGSLGYSSIPGTDEVWLHRFYVKATLKGQGIGSALYARAEAHLLAQGKTAIRVHLGGAGYEDSRGFYQHRGFQYDGDLEHMRKALTPVEGKENRI